MVRNLISPPQNRRALGFYPRNLIKKALNQPFEKDPPISIHEVKNSIKRFTNCEDFLLSDRTTFKYFHQRAHQDIYAQVIEPAFGSLIIASVVFVALSIFTRNSFKENAAIALLSSYNCAKSAFSSNPIKPNEYMKVCLEGSTELGSYSAFAQNFIQKASLEEEDPSHPNYRIVTGNHPIPRILPHADRINEYAEWSYVDSHM